MYPCEEKTATQVHLTCSRTKVEYTADWCRRRGVYSHSSAPWVSTLGTEPPHRLIPGKAPFQPVLLQQSASKTTLIMVYTAEGKSGEPERNHFLLPCILKLSSTRQCSFLTSPLTASATTSFFSGSAMVVSWKLATSEKSIAHGSRGVGTATEVVGHCRRGRMERSSTPTYGCEDLTQAFDLGIISNGYSFSQ